MRKMRDRLGARAAVATARRHPWAAFIAAAVLLVLPAAVWARLQQGSPWPMFQRDTQHSGRSGLRGPDSWEVRWYYQTGNSITASPALTNPNGALRCYYLRWEDGPTPNNFTPALLMSPAGPPYGETAHMLPPVTMGKGKGKIATWVTADGDPGEETLPTGEWRFVMRASSSKDDSATLSFKVYGLTKNGQERELLFETGESATLSALDTTVEVFHTVSESIDTSNYERLLVEIWADADKETNIRLTLLLWPYAALIETSYAKPAVFMGSTDGRFYALSQADGKLLWSYDTGAAVESPAAIDDSGTIYVGNAAGLLYCFNLAGHVEWVYGDDPTLSEPPDEPIVGIVGGPTVSDQGAVYITTESGMLQAIDSANGDLLWTWPGELDQDIPLDYPILTSPAIGSAGTIYITRYDGFLYAIAPDGETQWSFEVPELKADGQPYPMQSSPAVTSVKVGNDVHDLVLFGSHSGRLYAVYQEQITDTQGTLLWKFPASDPGAGVITSTPAIQVDNSNPEEPKTYVWFGAGNGRVYKVDVDNGSEALSRITTADIPVRSSACIDLRVNDDNADGYVYIGANDGRVHAWDLDGNRPNNWPFDPRAIAAWQATYLRAYPFVSSPCLGRDSSLEAGDNELLFIGGLDGIVYCLGPGEGGAPNLPPPQNLPELTPRLSLNKQRDVRAAWYNFDKRCPDVIEYTLWINNRGEVPATITELTDEIVDEHLRQYVQLASKKHGNEDCDGNPTSTPWDPTVWWEMGSGRWMWDLERNPLEVDARETITIVLKIETKPNLSRLNPDFGTPVKIHDNPNLDPTDPERRAWEPHEHPDDPNRLIFPGDNGGNAFDWGQHVCLDVRGVGNSERLRNRATIHYTAPEGGRDYKMDSNIALTSLGWMNRWLLIFRYDSTVPAADPVLNVVPQAPTHYILIDSQQSRGRRSAGDATFQYWNDKTDADGKHVLLVKVYLDPTVAPRGDPIEKLEGLTETDVLPMDVAKQQSRPWVPYQYTVRVLQAVALSLADYGAPPPPPGQPMPPALDPRRNAKWSDGSWQLPPSTPVIIHNPLDALEEIGKDASGNPLYGSLAYVNIGGTDPLSLARLPIEFNPGSSTGNTRVLIKNRTRGLPFKEGSGIRPGWPMVPPGSGRYARAGQPGRRPDQRNVVRWSEVDLLYVTRWITYGAGYDPYRENTIGQDRIRIGPGPIFEIGPGSMETMLVAADIPKYLHAGLYLAPGGSMDQAGTKNPDQYRIYIDLNGNETWDPGEAFFQNEPTGFEPNLRDRFPGQYEPLTMRLRVAEQPLLRVDEDTVDLGKVAAGTAFPRRALLTLRNAGNTLLSGLRYDIGSRSGFSGAGEVTQRYLEPSWLRTDWLAPNLTQPLSAFFIPVPAPYENLWINGFERPVTGKTPVGAPEAAGTRYEIYDQTENVKVPVGQPVGTYVGNLVWYAKGKRPDGPELTETSDSATIKATVVESPLAVGAGVGAGADIMPTACPDPTGVGMDVVWSSSTGDTHQPPWYRLYRDRYDFTTRQWGGRGVVATGAGAYETGVLDLAYLYPSLTTGSDGAKWLAWSGTARRPGGGGQPETDNRVFLQPWGTASTVAFPPLGQPGVSQYAVVSPQAWIQTVLDGEQQVNKTGVLIWSRGADIDWTLRCSYAVADPSQQASWRGDQALYTSRSDITPRLLSYSRDPVVLPPTQLTMLPESERRLIHLLFTGFTSYLGNADIYYARYDPLLLEDASYQNGQQPFAPVPKERLLAEPDDPRMFYTRHKEWWVDWYADQQHKELEPPILYVDGAAWTGNPGAKVYDRQRGLVTWTVMGYNVQYSPSLGRLQFLGEVPPGTLELTYTPCLLRVTDSQSGDAGPAAFLEWPRYRGESGEPYPLDAPNLWAVRPRLWLFWRRTAARDRTPRLYYKTFRYYIQQAAFSPVDPQWPIPARLGWLEEIRCNTDAWRDAWHGYDPTLNLTEVWSLDAPDSAVPADVQIEDIGVAAAKDPSTSSVWLFWSSLRTPVAGNPAEPSSDIFYQAFNPAMPDALIAPQPP